MVGVTVGNRITVMVGVGVMEGNTISVSVGDGADVSVAVKIITTVKVSVGGSPIRASRV